MLALCLGHCCQAGSSACNKHSPVNRTWCSRPDYQKCGSAKQPHVLLSRTQLRLLPRPGMAL